MIRSGLERMMHCGSGARQQGRHGPGGRLDTGLYEEAKKLGG